MRLGPCCREIQENRLHTTEGECEFLSVQTSTDVFVHYSAVWPIVHDSAKSLGWIEHTLPDSSKYYTHETMRVTTDVDLQDRKKLKAVSDFLQLPEQSANRTHTDRWELWLREMGATKDDIVLSRFWVNHGGKTVSSTPPPTTLVEDFSLLSMSGHDDRTYSGLHFIFHL